MIQTYMEISMDNYHYILKGNSFMNLSDYILFKSNRRYELVLIWIKRSLVIKKTEKILSVLSV